MRIQLDGMKPKIQERGLNPGPLAPYPRHLIGLQLESSLFAMVSHPDISGDADGTD